MRILHTIPHFAPALRWGGPVLLLLDLAREQARQGHEVTVLTTNLDVDGVLQVPLRQPVPMQGLNVWYCPAAKRSFDFSLYASHFLKARARTFDIIHIHTVFSWMPTISALWAFRRRVPYMVLPQGALSPICLTKPYDKLLNALRSRVKKWVYFKTLSQRVLDRASAIHFCTEQEREDARPLALKAPSFVIPLGADPVPADVRAPGPALRERFPVLTNKPIILYLSRLDPIKGLDVLIEALGNVARQGYEFGFVVAGGGPEAFCHELTALVERHGITRCTFFLGPIFGDLKVQILREADLFVLTSRHENLGLAVLEAMSAGLPVVVSKSVNIHTEITRAGAGISTRLVADEIAAALRQLIDSQRLRAEMGQRGQRLVNDHFAWPRVVENLTKAYDQIIKAKEVSPAHLPRKAAPEQEMESVSYASIGGARKLTRGIPD